MLYIIPWAEFGLKSNDPPLHVEPFGHATHVVEFAGKKYPELHVYVFGTNRACTFDGNETPHAFGTFSFTNANVFVEKITAKNINIFFIYLFLFAADYRAGDKITGAGII